MRFEHFAINVPRPREMANWYVTHLKMRVVYQQDEAPFMTFLADASGRVVMEIYNNPTAPIPDYEKAHHLTFHMAFQTDDAQKVKHYLCKEGATLVEEILPGEGSHLVMLRDPWGIPLQICQRKDPFTTKDLFP